MRYYYLIELQYLGFRYHGWQRQPGLKTVERMVNRTVNFVLEGKKFKVLAAGRTDAMVSVNQTVVELFIYDNPLNIPLFFENLNRNLPSDIRALDISETNADFNIIQYPKVKEYLYSFCFDQKFHPFCAPFMTNIVDSLDLNKMRRAAQLFEGFHDFWAYTFRPTPRTQTRGEILKCTIKENMLYQGAFFPKQSYLLQVQGAGFKRHQIRLMMGALIKVGKGEFDLAIIERSLDNERGHKMTYVAPASGLLLNKVALTNDEIYHDQSLPS